MNDLLDYFVSLDSLELYNSKIKLLPNKTEVRVFGSISPYLFETLDVEMMNGDYVVISENISDDEADYLIKDNKITKVKFEDHTLADLFVDTGVLSSALSNGEITIDSEGYYLIDGVKTGVLAPTNKDKILSTSDINSEGINMFADGDKIYMSKTLYDASSKKIVNVGYDSSIKIKIVFSDTSNMYYEMQLAAKLSDKLALFNGLTMADIKSMVYFKGFDDPINLYKNDLWSYFKALVQVEDDVAYYESLGYKVELISKNKSINPNGTIDHKPAVKGLEYTIKTTYNNVEEKYTFMKLI